MFISLASRAADFEDCYLLVEDALHSVSKQVNEKIKGTPIIDAEKSSVQETFSLPEQYAHAAGLKKKMAPKCWCIPSHRRALFPPTSAEPLPVCCGPSIRW